MKILLAADDQLLGSGLRTGLRQAGFQVDWVRDGAAAQREIEESDYDAMVLDLGLPLRDAGCAAARAQTAMIAILLRNLIDNAVRYSPPGASIRVTLKNDGTPSIKIEDSGPGLSADQQSKLGERFFRVLGSAETGCGLGWSIVRRIAQAHNLPITTERSSEFGGFQLTVRWPRTEANAC